MQAYACDKRIRNHTYRRPRLKARPVTATRLGVSKKSRTCLGVSKRSRKLRVKRKNNQCPAEVRGDGKACYNRMRLFYAQLFWFNVRAILSKTPPSPRKSAGFTFLFFIPTTGSVRIAHYTCGYFSTARRGGLYV